MLLRCGGEVMAVDVGKSIHSDMMLKLLGEMGVTHMTVFNSHPHDDHCGGISTLLGREVAIDGYYTGFPDTHHGDSSIQQGTVARLKEAGVPILHVASGDVITLGGAECTVMQYMFRDGNVNNSSCVLLVKYGERSLLLTGDLDFPGQGKLVIDHPELGHVDIMKAPHHGHVYLKYDFLKAVRPELVFITGGMGTSAKARRNLDSNRIPYLFASRGLIHLSTNGEYWLVEQIAWPQ